MRRRLLGLIEIALSLKAKVSHPLTRWILLNGCRFPEQKRVDRRLQDLTGSSLLAYKAENT
jgi:hypothetical protein